jgi:epsilon-lactone hydrolase
LGNLKAATHKTLMNTDPTNTAAAVAKPSLRGRIATRLVRSVVKRWAKGGPLAIVRRARRVFGYPDLLNLLHSRGLEIVPVETDAVRGEWIRPSQCQVKDRVLLYLHGGGYVSCSPKTHRPITAALARLMQCPVFALDYRLAPEHPFPAAVDDAAAAFQWLVEGGIAPEKIAVAGDSAGGGLAIAIMLRLRAQGQPLPACAALLSPWVNLTGAGSYRNAGSWSMFQPSDVITFAKLYLHGAPADSGEASPLFADLRGLPPVLIHASSTELLMDDSVRLHEKARSSGVKSTLRVYSGLPHAWHIFVPTIPEAGHALQEIADFILREWSESPLHPTTEGGRGTRESPTPAYNQADVTH